MTRDDSFSRLRSLCFWSRVTSWLRAATWACSCEGGQGQPLLTLARPTFHLAPDSRSLSCGRSGAPPLPRPTSSPAQTSASRRGVQKHTAFPAPQASSSHSRGHRGRALLLSPPTLHHSPPSGHPRLPPAGSSGLGSGWPWPPLSPGPPAASGAAPPAAPGPCRAPAPAPAAQPEPQPAPGVRRARPGVRAWTSLAPSPGPLAHLEPYLEELVSLLPQVTVLAGPTHWGTVHCAVLQRLCQELSLRLAHADCPSQELHVQ